jgi:hypothetical protein
VREKEGAPVDDFLRVRHRPAMSTVVEIEAAIEKLALPAGGNVEDFGRLRELPRDIDLL